MTRKGGEETKRKILDAAEELFSKKGFHETSIKEITQAAGVNQGLVYYYFKDKADIVNSLFKGIIGELSAAGEGEAVTSGREASAPDLKGALRDEVSFLQGRARIISVMLMESLKAGDQDTNLFRCAEFVMSDHHPNGGPKTAAETAYEFFTGFIPLIAFAAFHEKFCDYFKFDREQALEAFLDAFMASHISSHDRRGNEPGQRERNEKARRRRQPKEE